MVQNIGKFSSWTYCVAYICAVLAFILNLDVRCIDTPVYTCIVSDNIWALPRQIVAVIDWLSISRSRVVNKRTSTRYRWASTQKMNKKNENRLRSWDGNVYLIITGFVHESCLSLNDTSVVTKHRMAGLGMQSIDYCTLAAAIYCGRTA